MLWMLSDHVVLLSTPVMVVMMMMKSFCHFLRWRQNAVFPVGCSAGPWKRQIFLQVSWLDQKSTLEDCHHRTPGKSLSALICSYEGRSSQYAHTLYYLWDPWQMEILAEYGKIHGLQSEKLHHCLFGHPHSQSLVRPGNGKQSRILAS